jgi:hypothetical protein
MLLCRWLVRNVQTERRSGEVLCRLGSELAGECGRWRHWIPCGRGTNVGPACAHMFFRCPDLSVEEYIWVHLAF